jgi:hypothetical protein
LEGWLLTAFTAHLERGRAGLHFSQAQQAAAEKLLGKRRAVVRVVHVDLDWRLGGDLSLDHCSFSRSRVAVVLAGLERHRHYLQSAMDERTVAPQRIAHHATLALTLPPLTFSLPHVAAQQPKRAQRLLSRYLPALLALLPLACLVIIVIQYGVNVPYLDAWDLVPLLEKSYRGDLQPSDFWVLHNEHRFFFPKLIMVGLARATGWNIRCEEALNVGLSVVTFLLLGWQLRFTARRLGSSHLLWALPVASLVVFSISQYQNWLWGWEVTMILNLLAVVAGILVLCHGTFSWARFAVSAFLGIVATYSLASGSLFWPIGCLILLVTTKGKIQRALSQFLWLCISALAIGLYFHHYERKGPHAPLGLALSRPAERLVYVFKYLGSICAQYPGDNPRLNGVLALLYGVGASAAFCFGVWALLTPGKLALSRPGSTKAEPTAPVKQRPQIDCFCPTSAWLSILSAMPW